MMPLATTDPLTLLAAQLIWVAIAEVRITRLEREPMMGATAREWALAKPVLRRFHDDELTVGGVTSLAHILGRLSGLGPRNSRRLAIAEVLGDGNAELLESIEEPARELLRNIRWVTDGNRTRSSMDGSIVDSCDVLGVGPRRREALGFLEVGEEVAPRPGCVAREPCHRGVLALMTASVGEEVETRRTADHLQSRVG